tara:strand:- start:9350 stop:10126 length:777 start_codon:yes stop_codon:yes gene_type:complete
MESTKDYKRVYVWQLPVRIFHWLNALSIVVLAITGFLIADPPAFLSQSEAFDSYLLGYIRAIHFISAYVFVGVMILRLYWSIVGNRYAHWRAFWPFSKKAWHNIVHVIKHDIFLLPEKNPKLSNISIGHNHFATLAYFLMFVFAFIMVFTGFGLYAQNSTWFFPKLFAWVPSLLGGDFLTRQIHHISMWFIFFFIIVHIYLVLYHDWLEVRGETSSMISGFKFVRKERVIQEEKLEGEVLDPVFEESFDDENDEISKE